MHDGMPGCHTVRFYIQMDTLYPFVYPECSSFYILYVSVFGCSSISGGPAVSRCSRLPDCELEMYSRSGLVISRSQGLQYDTGLTALVLMS